MTLQIVDGDLWDHWDKGARIVLTTNIGWDPVTLRNNMGAGVVSQAMRRWPDLPVWYGRLCELNQEAMRVVFYPDRRLYFLPVKPLLDVHDPERSWAQRADPVLIERGLKELGARAIADEGRHKIALSFPGCGNGALDESEVWPLMEKHLPHDGSVVVVRYKPNLRHGFNA